MPGGTRAIKNSAIPALTAKARCQAGRSCILFHVVETRRIVDADLVPYARPWLGRSSCEQMGEECKRNRSSHKRRRHSNCTFKASLRGSGLHLRFSLALCGSETRSHLL